MEPDKIIDMVKNMSFLYALLSNLCRSAQEALIEPDKIIDNKVKNMSILYTCPGSTLIATSMLE